MQFLFLRSIKPYVVFLLTSMLLFTTGCEDDDHDDHDHEEGHTDADGFILEDAAGNEMYREFEGAMTGSVTLAVGDTLELSVHFLDHEGNEIEHSEEEGEEHDEEHHGSALHVIGVSAGSTSFTLQLMHDGHADYTSTNNVPVTVN